MTAQSALAQIRSAAQRNHTTRRFRGESVYAHRLRVGLVARPCVSVLSGAECLIAAAVCAVVGIVCLLGVLL